MSSSNLIAGVEAWLAEREAKCALTSPGPAALSYNDATNDLTLVVPDNSVAAPSPYAVLARNGVFAGRNHFDRLEAGYNVLPGTVAYGKQLVEALRKAEAELEASTTRWDDGTIRYGVVERQHRDTLRAQLAAFAEAHQITEAQQEGKQ